MLREAKKGYTGLVAISHYNLQSNAQVHKEDMPKPTSSLQGQPRLHQISHSKGMS